MKFALPKTRYYGSKRKLISWIWDALEKENLEFESVLDIFGGSGIFSYSAKKKGKKVSYNDIFKFNYHIGKALIENRNTIITKEDINYLLNNHSTTEYKYHVTHYFKDVYFPDEENRQIDVVCQNILNTHNKLKQSLFFYILFQSCMIKRPFNIFHRKNLNLRTNNVHRNFGNKRTWEIPFRDLFVRFSTELNEYVFDNGRNNSSYNYSALKCPIEADLVYIDPPYMNDRKNHTSYLSRYHFLEGLANYNNFTNHINFKKKNLEIEINTNNEFEDYNTFFRNFKVLVQRNINSVIVISYREHGIPAIEELVIYLQQIGKDVSIYRSNYSYALNRDNANQEEVLIIAR